MAMKCRMLVLLAVLMMALPACRAAAPDGGVVVGAARTDAYLPLLKGKRVALFSNQTLSLIHISEPTRRTTESRR